MKIIKYKGFWFVVIKEAAFIETNLVGLFRALYLAILIKCKRRIT